MEELKNGHLNKEQLIKMLKEKIKIQKSIKEALFQINGQIVLLEELLKDMNKPIQGKEELPPNNA